jgi:uncharacterized protein
MTIISNNADTNQLPELLQTVPLFLLSNVLFPNGVLRLRVFEQRYIDMVRQCMREKKPFGVCLITKGKEANAPKDFVRVGCLARIVDFDMAQLGVLEIRCNGEQRFEVQTFDVQKDGLVLAQVKLIEPDAVIAIPDDLQTCASLAQELVKEIERKLDEESNQVIAAPYEFESAAWVGNRLCEVLPISPAARQELMALRDPLSRLNLVEQYLRNKQIFNS